MSQQLWGTPAQQVSYECFYQGEWWSAVEHEESPMRVFIRVNGEVQWSMRSQPWVFLSGWMVKCSGAWGVTHEGFYQGEWWSAVEHDESTMRVFIRVTGEMQWSMSHPWGLSGWMVQCSGVNHEGFYQGEWRGAVEHDESTMRVFIWMNGEVQWSEATVEKYWIRQQWKCTGSGNSGKVPDLSTLQLHSFRDTWSSPPKKVSRPAKIKRCKHRPHKNYRQTTTHALVYQKPISIPFFGTF